MKINVCFGTRFSSEGCNFSLQNTDIFRHVSLGIQQPTPLYFYKPSLSLFHRSCESRISIMYSNNKKSHESMCPSLV